MYTSFQKYYQVHFSTTKYILVLSSAFLAPSNAKSVLHVQRDFAVVVVTLQQLLDDNYQIVNNVLAQFRLHVVRMLSRHQVRHLEALLLVNVTSLHLPSLHSSN
jgi:predicted RecB family endonuclease